MPSGHISASGQVERCVRGVVQGKGGEREGRESETWQMNSYTYQDKHASIHVVNVHNTYKHNMLYTVHDSYNIDSG